MASRPIVQLGVHPRGAEGARPIQQVFSVAKSDRGSLSAASLF